MSYQFLQNITAPRHLVEAVKLLGTKEVAGSASNPVIMGWAKEVGLAPKFYTGDDVPWCGLYMAVVMHRAQRPVVSTPLWARSWNRFGIAVKTAMLGDVLVFSRGQHGGHVGIYVGEDATAYHVLGGNQSDAVTVTRILKSRCIGIRRPPYNNIPASVQIVRLTATGTISTNEA